MDLNSTTVNQSCDVFIYSMTTQVIFPIFYTLVFFISISGNSLVLYVTCQKQKKFKSTTLYLINLALSDTLFILALPSRITYYILEFDWPFGDLFCRISTVIFYTNTYASIAFMACISLDRYLAMIHPHRLMYLRKSEVVRAICGLVWLLVFLQTAPLLFRNMLGENRGKRTCMEFFSFEDSRFLPYLLLVACTISFCIPLGLILICYTQINLKLSRTAKENLWTSRSKCSHRTNNVILMILFSFVMCFSPYHINVMQFMIRKVLYTPSCVELTAFKMSLQITVSMMNLNCCLDPIIYFFAIKTYKQRVMSIFRDCLSPTVPLSKTMSENSSSNT